MLYFILRCFENRSFFRWTQNNVNPHNDTQSCTTPYLKHHETGRFACSTAVTSDSCLVLSADEELVSITFSSVTEGPWLAPYLVEIHRENRLEALYGCSTPWSSHAINERGEHGCGFWTLLWSCSWPSTNLTGQGKMTNDLYFILLYHALPFFIHFPCHSNPQNLMRGQFTGNPYNPLYFMVKTCKNHGFL